MVFQEPSLVGLEQEAFDTFRGQEEQPPVRVLDKPGTGRLVLLEVEHDVREGGEWQISRGNLLANRSLKYSEVA